MATSPPSKSGLPWTTEETDTFRRLVKAGVPAQEIACQLGRSRNAIGDYARKIGVKAARPGEAPASLRQALPAPGVGDDRPELASVGDHRSSDEGTPPSRLRPAMPGAAELELRLRIVRLNRPSLPWIWEIRRDGAAHPLARSEMGFRSAEDAWTEGKAVLASTECRGLARRFMA